MSQPRGRLNDPVILEQQVQRLLADERSSVLVSSFAGQWLHLRRMRSVAPDVNAFPTFDENLREAFVRETELFVDSQLRDDRSVVDLLTADYTFVNERLARHYGIPDVHGSRFRRVTQPDDTRRGLLGHGSILTVTSLATRTSPVVRGKWLLENILGAPPPLPPPNVPPLRERADAGELTSLRERLEAHRASPVCANCHARMDPIGFAFENFDAVGRWRETDDDAPIDPSGVLPDGTAFDGLPELRDVLLSRSDEFVVTVTEKLLTYALGRGIEYPRSARHPRDRARGQAQRLPLVVDYPGCGPEHAVPDEEIGIMIITKKALPRRTVLRGLGAAVALPLLDGMVPALTAARQDRRETAKPRLGVVYVPTGP